MSNAVFGLTMLVVGMGGTLVTLGIITLIIRALRALLPVRPAKEEAVK